MTGTDWLNAVTALIQERSLQVDVSRPDDDTLALANGVQGVVLHVITSNAYLMTSTASGSTIADRIQERVTYFEPEQFQVESASLQSVVKVILGHLTEP